MCNITKEQENIPLLRWVKMWVTHKRVLDTHEEVCLKAHGFQLIKLLTKGLK